MTAMPLVKRISESAGRRNGHDTDLRSCELRADMSVLMTRVIRSPACLESNPQARVYFNDRFAELFPVVITAVVSVSDCAEIFHINHAQ